MGYMGYVKVPRELFASEEWSRKRRFSRIEAQIDLLQAASYTDGRIVHCTSGDIVLRRGQLLTSTRYLGERWGWGHVTVARYLQELQSEPRNSIRIRIEKTSEANKTLITICNFDGWYMGGFSDETQNETQNETGIETHDETIENNVTRCIAHSCSDSIRHSETQHETPDETPDETYIEIKDSNTGKKKEAHTQVRDLKEGVVGGTIRGPEVDAARGLIGWVETRASAIASMREPLTIQNAVWMLRRYDVEDIRRIIAMMQSKGAHLRNSNAYATFVSYAKLDIILRRKREARRGYTYAEFCDLTGAQGKFSSEDFVRREVGGRPLWFIKPSVAPSN